MPVNLSGLSFGPIQPAQLLANPPLMCSPKTRDAITTQLSHQGLLVLDAHRNTLDIIATTLAFTQTFPITRLIFPTAGYDLHIPLAKQLFTKLNAVPGVSILPVFRWEDKYHPYLLLKLFHFLFPVPYTTSRMNDTNRYFLDQAQNTLKQPGSVVLVAPYGSPRTFKGKIRRGVSHLIQSGAPVICTLSRFSFSTCKYQTRLSSLSSFSRSTQPSRIKAIIDNHFSVLLTNSLSQYPKDGSGT